MRSGAKCFFPHGVRQSTRIAMLTARAWMQKALLDQRMSRPLIIPPQTAKQLTDSLTHSLTVRPPVCRQETTVHTDSSSKRM